VRWRPPWRRGGHVNGEAKQAGRDADDQLRAAEDVGADVDRVARAARNLARGASRFARDVERAMRTRGAT